MRVTDAFKKMNRRRYYLIVKKHTEGLSPTEAQELIKLQAAVRKRVKNAC